MPWPQMSPLAPSRISLKVLVHLKNHVLLVLVLLPLVLLVPALLIVVLVLVVPIYGSNGKKRRLSDEELGIMAGLTGAVNKLAEAVQAPVVVQTTDVHPDLYQICMSIPGFTDEELMTCLTYLLDNKRQGDGFVKMEPKHRVLWLRQHLAKI
ncbi:hypothetical protein ZEAMMB73_Zm00001d020259 [Zea mays]|uniref:Uncharacterized protein n=1 Tax=Zea mays TaxID=4577 RepID=A0A1D6I391_MAIZE|nr:hypothetical protein ZEAMMB73_Zm00001d020259 [Zea mays]